MATVEVAAAADVLEAVVVDAVAVDVPEAAAVEAVTADTAAGAGTRLRPVNQVNKKGHTPVWPSFFEVTKGTAQTPARLASGNLVKSRRCWEDSA